jgi:septal ring factor EnvC (AmiA/AmiB activator)
MGKLLALAFVGLMLFAQEPAKKPATIEELQAQVTQLQQQVAQKDQQIAAMSAQLTASGKMFSACFQSLAEAEQRAAAKKQ